MRIFVTGATGVVGRRAVPLLAQAGHEVTLVAEAAIAGGVERLIQEAFAPIYEDGGDRWIDEGWPVRPARYNRSVLDAERSAARFTASGRTGVVLRFGYFYGPDPGGATHAAIAAVKRGWAPWFGSPGGYLPALTHDDAATAVVAALGVPAGTYNIVDDEPLTRRENFGALAAALGVAPPKFMPAWMRHLAGSIGETLARSLRISNRRFRDVSGWAPRYPSAREGWPAAVRETEGP